MSAKQLSRGELTNLFVDGAAPIGEHFASIFISSLNKTDDGVQLNGAGNLELAKGGIRLNAAASGEAGTLRFAGSSLQYHDGSNYLTLSTGSGGAFVPIGATQNVAYQGGNVGIGSFSGSATPNRLDVVLGPNTGVNNRVKLGNLVIHNGAGTVANPNGAYIGNAALVENPGQYALFQDNAGNTIVNAAAATNQLLLSQGGDPRVRLNIAGGIELTPGVNQGITIGTLLAPKNLNVSGNLTVTGTINGTTIPPSDIRIKKDIQPFSIGFQKILSLNPVRFKYNGKAEIPEDGKERIGFIAQDLQKVYPELIVPQWRKLHPDDLEETEVLAYDPGPLTYVLINAVKEIAVRLQNVEKSVKHEKRKTRNTAGING